MARQRVRFPELNRLHAQYGRIPRDGAIRGLGGFTDGRGGAGPGCVIDGVDRTSYCAHNALIGNRLPGLSFFYAPPGIFSPTNSRVRAGAWRSRLYAVWVA